MGAGGGSSENAGPRHTREPDSDPRRVFLGWDRPLLAAAADHLVERFGDDLHDVVLALPGRRAGRRLEELLAVRGVRRPAEVTTAGYLTDRLLSIDVPRADRTERTLAWAHVLRHAPDLSALLSRCPEDDDFAGWLALAAGGTPPSVFPFHFYFFLFLFPFSFSPFPFSFFSFLPLVQGRKYSGSAKHLELL